MADHESYWGNPHGLLGSQPTDPDAVEMSEDEMIEEERRLAEEELDDCEAMGALQIARQGFNEDDIRAEIEHWDRRREDLNDVSDVIEMMDYPYTGRGRVDDDDDGEEE